MLYPCLYLLASVFRVASCFSGHANCLVSPRVVFKKTSPRCPYHWRNQICEGRGFFQLFWWQSVLLKTLHLPCRCQTWPWREAMPCQSLHQLPTHHLQEDSLKISCLPPTGPFVLCRYNFRQSPVTPVRGASAALSAWKTKSIRCRLRVFELWLGCSVMKAYESHHLRFLPVEGTFSSGISFAPTGSSERFGCNVQPKPRMKADWINCTVWSFYDHHSHGKIMEAHACPILRLMDFGLFKCVFHLKLSPQVQLHPLVLSASSGSWNCQVRWEYPLVLEINMAWHEGRIYQDMLRCCDISASTVRYCSGDCLHFETFMVTFASQHEASFWPSGCDSFPRPQVYKWQLFLGCCSAAVICIRHSQMAAPCQCHSAMQMCRSLRCGTARITAAALCGTWTFADHEAPTSSSESGFESLISSAPATGRGKIIRSSRGTESSKSPQSCEDYVKPLFCTSFWRLL